MTGLMYHLTSYMDTMIFSKLCYLGMTFYSDEKLDGLCTDFVNRHNHVYVECIFIYSLAVYCNM